MLLSVLVLILSGCATIPEPAEAHYYRELAIDSVLPIPEAVRDMVRKAGFRQESADREAGTLNLSKLPMVERSDRELLDQNESKPAGPDPTRVITERISPSLWEGGEQTISMEMRDVPLTTIFRTLSRKGGINFILDRHVRGDTRTSINLRDTNVGDVVNVLLVIHQLALKIVNENTFVIYPANREKHREYRELSVRSFYLSNVRAEQAAELIRTMVKTRDLHVDENLNLVIMRDTPDAIRFAEQLVATQDLAEPEVMLELEVLEISSSLVRELGLRFPERLLLFGEDVGGSIADQVNLARPQARVFALNPLVDLNFRELRGGANILANPRIRVMNRERAMIHVGERVPVVTTTVEQSVGVTSSVNFLETGLKIDLVPTVHLNDDVSIRVELEVSNILEQLNISGTVAYRLGTRTTSTVLRLKDGETQVLAGLINREDRSSLTKVPGVSRTPWLRRLFGRQDDGGVQTEIVLQITPRVVRNVDRPVTVREMFQSGTETTPGAVTLQLSTQEAGMSVIFERIAAPVVARQGADATELGVASSPQVRIGEEFGISLAMPAGNEGESAVVQLNFDPTIFEFSGQIEGGVLEEQNDGYVSVRIARPIDSAEPSPPGQVMFRVLATNPVVTEISIDLIDSGGAPITIPPAQLIEVVDY